MNKEIHKSETYIDWTIFKEIPTKTVTITTDSDSVTITKYIMHFICETPVGSGKSTAIREWLSHTIPDEKYILIVSTVNITLEFYSKLCKILNYDNLVKVCVKYNAFADFKKAIQDTIPIVITTYFTASKCLGGIIESFYSELKNDVGLYKSKEISGKYQISESSLERI